MRKFQGVGKTIAKMTAASLRFRSVCEEDLDKVLND